MTQHYSDPGRASDPWALPDVETFQLTAREAAERDEDMIHVYLKRFPLATMNGRDRDRMFDTMIEEEGITGGWYYWFCFPGCMPDSEPMGPYETEQEAVDAAQDRDSY